MRKTNPPGICLALLCAVMISACSQNWNWDDSFPDGGGGGGMWGGGSSSGVISFDVLSTFTVKTNTEALAETETVPTDENDEYYNDYVENNFSAKNTTTVTFNGGNATVSGIVDGDTINVNGGNVEVRAHSKGLTLAVSGTTTEGSLKIYSEKKFQLKLNNASITNPDGAAINIQNGNCFFVLAGTNSLSDGESATYSTTEGEDMKAVLFSEDDLRISGNGSLAITAQNKVGKAGISSDDAVFIRPFTNIQVTANSSAGNGIKANDAIIIKGGVLNIETASNGSKGLSSDCYMQIDGGRVTAITTGGVDATNSADPSGCAAIKCDSVLRINGGELWLKSTGQGGKGISGDEAMYIDGGDIYIITEGKIYGTTSSNNGPWGGSSSSTSVSPKGIRCDKDITISGGNIYIRTSGTNGEGIESKATLSFTGGNTAALAYDDGFNAKTINISGGKALAVSSGDCDGIDSNGAIKATGGVLIGVSSTLSSEDGLDHESTMTISNATVIGLCGSGMEMGGTQISGHYIKTNITGNQGDYVALTDGSTPLVTFKLPRNYSSGKLILSTPSMASSTYTLQTGVTPTGGTLWMNYLEDCKSVSGGSSTSVKSN